MSTRSFQRHTTSSTAGDIDAALLRDTQAYLGCLVERRPPAAKLIAAWQRFYEEFCPVVARFALACGVPQNDLHDCAQEVWTAVVTNLRHFRYDPQRGRFCTWLYALVRSKAIDRARQRTRHPTRNLVADDHAAIHSRDPDPATQCERNSERQLVRGALTELEKRVSKRSYRVVQLRWIEGRTVPEVAAALGLTAEQVRFRDHRAKKKLRRLLELRVDSELPMVG